MEDVDGQSTKRTEIPVDRGNDGHVVRNKIQSEGGEAQKWYKEKEKRWS